MCHSYEFEPDRDFYFAKNLFFLANSESPIKLKNPCKVRKFKDFYEFTLCRHVTTSTCIETLLRINIRAHDFRFLSPLIQHSNTTISIPPVYENRFIF